MYNMSLLESYYFYDLSISEFNLKKRSFLIVSRLTEINSDKEHFYDTNIRYSMVLEPEREDLLKKREKEREYKKKTLEEQKREDEEEKLVQRRIRKRHNKLRKRPIAELLFFSQSKTEKTILPSLKLEIDN